MVVMRGAIMFSNVQKNFLNTVCTKQKGEDVRKSQFRVETLNSNYCEETEQGKTKIIIINSF